MERGSTIILRGAIILLGLAVLAFCSFVLPAEILSGKTGYYQPILIGMYVPAIPFFIALYQALRLLRYIDGNKAFSALSVRALRSIKFCAIAIGVIYTAGMPYIYYAAQTDDAPGVLAIGLVIVFASFVIATSMAILQKLLQQAIVIKSENDLTV